MPILYVESLQESLTGISCPCYGLCRYSLHVTENATL